MMEVATMEDVIEVIGDTPSECLRELADLCDSGGGTWVGTLTLNHLTDDEPHPFSIISVVELDELRMEWRGHIKNGS